MIEKDIAIEMWKHKDFFIGFILVVFVLSCLAVYLEKKFGIKLDA
jgi:hypothetical protein